MAEDTQRTPTGGADSRAAQIGRVVELVRDRYVFPEVAERVVAALRAKTYDEGLSDEAFGAEVTADLQSVNGDKHLRLVYKVDPLPEGKEPFDLEAYTADTRHRAYGIPRVERLPGNVGLLEFRQLDAPEIAAAAVTGAFGLVAHTDALIIDLRRSLGGDPSQVQYVCTYLWDESVHLNSIYDRLDGTTKQYWTHAYVPGERFGETKPVWVLTSAATFSGGEELAYDIQSHGRGTLVGETTRGGAHPTGWHRVSAHLQVTVPFARSINPVTGTNWEGTGVLPDIQVPAGEAFNRAYKLALDHVLTLGDTGLRRGSAAEATDALATLGAQAEPGPDA